MRSRGSWFVVRGSLLVAWVPWLVDRYPKLTVHHLDDLGRGTWGLGLGGFGITITLMHAQTRRQREVLDFITRYIDSHGYRPSYQVIARHMGVNSRAGIARIVHDLESQGLLTRRRENGHFYIDLGGAQSSNDVAGGAAIEWLDVEDVDGEADRTPFALPEFMLSGFDPAVVRAFRVPDNGLSSSNICEDDIALVEVREFARDGQRVVAVVKDQTLLRKYYRDGASVELRGDDGEVIRLAADRVEIKGIFRGLLRPLS